MEWILSLEDSNKAGSEEGMEIGRKIRKSLRAQSLTAIALALGLWITSPVAAYSSLFGSLAVFIPALVFAVLVASKIGSDSAVFLSAAVIGETVKLVLTGVICTVVFVWVDPLAAGWFFAGMILVIFIGYIGLYKA
ncbi:MAG: ATP synthase protein I [Lysobacterales bacterium]